MKKTFAVLVLLLGMSFSVQAKIRKPNPIGFVTHHKVAIALTLSYLAADIADTEETIQAQKRCPSCAETSDLYGPHPSSARLWGESTAFDVGYVALIWYGTKGTGLTGVDDFTPAEREKHPVLYKLCYLEKPVTAGVILYGTAGHARSAYNNAQIGIKP